MDNELFVLGRYIPGTSVVHRMDPRAKLLLTLVVMVAMFLVEKRNFVGMTVCALFMVAFYALSNITLRDAFRAIGPLLLIVLFVAVIDILFASDGEVLFEFSVIRITTGGFIQAGFVAYRLTLLLLDVSLLTLTTPTLDITEAMERLLSPFKRFGLPAHELGMMMAIALRFLPQFVYEVQVVYRAQISRGANFSKGKVSMLASLLIPLFTSAFRHADTLSSAMEARCYHGGEGRTRLHELHYTRLDAVGTGVVVLMVVLVLVVNVLV